MSSKTRIRNTEELIDRKKGFIEIIEILNDLKVYFFIQGGVLLGAVRNKDFIRWDWDVEISLFSKEFLIKKNLIREALLKKGFKIYKENYNEDKIKIDVYKYQNYETTGYTLFGWLYNKYKDQSLRGEINIPASFINNMEKMKFHNIEINCPGPVEEYLKYQYGNWKQELRSDDKKKYLTQKFYKKRNLINKIVKKLKNVFFK